MGYPQLQVYATSHFYHSVGLVFVYSKFKHRINICIKARKYSPKVSQYCRVHPIAHEYSESYTPFWDKIQSQNECHLQPNSFLLETFTVKGA